MMKVESKVQALFILGSSGVEWVARGKVSKLIFASFLLTHSHERAKYPFVNLVQYFTTRNRIH